MGKRKKNNGIVLFVLLTFFVISFLTNVLGALNPSATQSFGLTDTMTGFLPFSFFIAYGVASIPAGIFLERYGQKKMLLTAFILSLIGSLTFSLLPTFTTFLGSLFIIGTGMAILQVVINPLLREAGGEEHYAFNSVLGQLCFGAAAFVAPYIYSQLVLNGLDWSLMYALFAILSGLMLILVLLFKFPQMVLTKKEKMGSLTIFKNLISRRTVILFFFGIFAYVGAEQGISYWISTFLHQYHGFDFETTGAAAVGNFWGLMTLGGILGLVMLKLFDSKVVLRIFTAITIICLALGMFGSAQIALYAFQACGFFMAVMYPIIISLALNSMNEHHGSFAGILMSGIMGGAVFQVLIGLMSDATSLKIGMLLNFAAMAFIFSIGIWSKPIVTNKTLRNQS